MQLSKYLDLFDLSGSTLEMGAGNGNTASQVVKAMTAGSRLVCIDVSGKALATMPHGLRNDPRASSAVADARTTPFRDGAFKSIFVRHVLTHAIPGDESRILSETHRLLAEDGRAILEVFTPGDMRYGKGSRIAPGVFLHGDGLVWRFFGEVELRKAAAKSLLEILELEVVSRRVRFDGKEYPRVSIVAIVSRV